MDNTFLKGDVMLEVLNMLGYKGKDKVTGQTGVITSICFDLYGCVQAVLNPGKNKDGKLGECHWFDVDRITLTSKKPVMKQPEFVNKAKVIVKGPEHKPIP